MPPPTPLVDLRETTAWTELPSRGTVLATGGGAAAFVDKFTTAALTRIAPGAGSEGFFADARGWVLALAGLLRTDDGLVIDCDAVVAGPLRDHLEHHHIREDVALVDASAAVACLAIAGPAATEWLERRGCGPLPGAGYGHRHDVLGPAPVHVARVDWFGGDGFVLRVAAADADPLRRWLDAQDLPRGDAAFEVARIEARFPLAHDIPAKALPQELGRTDRAICFTKGCYLGQETVARIDALGHVNRSLVLMAIDAADTPAPGATVACGGAEVGAVTSTGRSPRLGPCGLAIVPRRCLDAGTVVTVAGHAARIVPAAWTPEA